MSHYDQSYGVVPLYRDRDEWKVLLIEQISYRGRQDRFWTFPKGHAEPGETPEVAALRELAEETGITNVTLEQAETFMMTYTFVHEGTTIQKNVFFYLGYVTDSATTVTHPDEIAAVRWCTLEEAKQLLSHENARQLLSEVTSFLSNV
jgi:bis(5'-nucleosidyl)-tetraphosphatase